MGQIFTTTQFYLHGKKHSTATGYLKHTLSYTSPFQLSPIATPIDNDQVDLTGKSIIITGGNSGIGLTLATYCASKNANVELFCRNEERAAKAVSQITSLTSNPNISYTVCDVSLKSSIDAAISSRPTDSPLHAVVCNAGVLLNDRQESSEGNELTLASHLVFGSYYLSKVSERAFWKTSTLSMGVTGDLVIRRFFIRFHLACTWGVLDHPVPEQPTLAKRCAWPNPPAVFKSERLKPMELLPIQ